MISFALVCLWYERTAYVVSPMSESFLIIIPGCVFKSRYCNSCLQECLRPKKPVCAVCRAALEKWGKDSDLEDLIHKTDKPCKGCGQMVCVRLWHYISFWLKCSIYMWNRWLLLLALNMKSTALSLPVNQTIIRQKKKSKWTHQRERDKNITQ